VLAVVLGSVVSPERGGEWRASARIRILFEPE